MGSVLDKVVAVAINPIWAISGGALFKVLGIETHEETITDLVVTPLLTPGLANENARRYAKRQAKGNMEMYFKSYRAFQRDYRKKYSKQFMLRQGYLPNSTATSRVITAVKAKSYIESLYGYDNVNVVSFGTGYLTDSQKNGHAVQQVGGYDFPTGQIVVSGKRYNNHQYSYPNSNQVQIVSTRLYDETIVQNLTDNYSYDGTYITIGGELYLVGDILDNINGSDQYETVCTHVPRLEDYEITIYNHLTSNYSYNNTTREVIVEGIIYEVPLVLDSTIYSGNYRVVVSNGIDPDVTIDVPIVYITLPDEIIYTGVQRITRTITNSAYATEADYIDYRVLSGEVGTELRHWIAVAGVTSAVYDIVVIDVTTIIPMKEDNVMVDTDDYKLNRMLRKLNLSGDVLKANIENPDLDSAYLMTGIDPTSNRSADIKTLFRSFDLISPGSGNITVSISKLSMKYTFTMTKTFVSGSIGPVGTYTKSTSGTGESAVMTLRYQGNSTEYKQLVISNFLQTYTVSGNNFAAYLTTGGGFCRIVVPLDVFNGLQYKDFVDVYEYGLCLLAYSATTIKIKWYETGAFGTLLKIAAIAITIISLGSASSVSAALWTIATAAAIMLAASMIASAIGGTFGAIVGAVVAIAAMAYFGGYGFESPELWLMSANKAIGVINQSIAMEMDKLSANWEAYLNEMTDKMGELKELNKEYEDLNPYAYTTFDSSYAGTPNPVFRSISEYCASILDTSDMSYIVDYGAQIQDALIKRTSITTI